MNLSLDPMTSIIIQTTVNEISVNSKNRNKEKPTNKDYIVEAN